jgi:predicted HicB family RNase H-like nuclease
MIDTDGERDHAEETAVRAESDAENATEQAHADLVNTLVGRLRTLSHNTHADAQETVASLSGDVNLRLAPNVHRYELLARHQHTALLAAIVASAVEETAEYDLDQVARSAIGGYRATHAGGRDILALGLLHATERVLDLVREGTR